MALPLCLVREPYEQNREMSRLDNSSFIRYFGAQTLAEHDQSRPANF